MSCGPQVLPMDIILKLESARKHTMCTLRDMAPREIGQLMRNVRMGDRVAALVSQFPRMEVHVTVKPITRGILQVRRPSIFVITVMVCNEAMCALHCGYCCDCGAQSV